MSWNSLKIMALALSWRMKKHRTFSHRDLTSDIARMLKRSSGYSPMLV